MARRLKLLDLFCGAGGAGMGYHRAGFDVVGVDIEPQPNYPFEFYQADALTFPLDGFDVIHASPPCQAYSTLRHAPGGDTEYPDLVADTRSRFIVGAMPYIIENVPGAPLVNPVQLCGSATGRVHPSYELRRHRLFECSFPVLVPPCNHLRPVLGVYGDLARRPRPSTRGVKAGIIEAQVLMGIDWMTASELVQAIPPAYTEFIGTQLLDQLTRQAVR